MDCCTCCRICRRSIRRTCRCCLLESGRAAHGLCGRSTRREGHDPSDEQVADAVRTCWQNTGTTRSASRLARRWSASRLTGPTSSMPVSREVWRHWPPRASGTATTRRSMPGRGGLPQEWLGVTALFAEDTGAQVPLDIDWSAEPRPDRRSGRAGLPTRDVGVAVAVHRTTPRECAGRREGRNSPRLSKRSPSLARSGTLPER